LLDATFEEGRLDPALLEAGDDALADLLTEDAIRSMYRHWREVMGV
jgi:hypothetical protein